MMTVPDTAGVSIRRNIDSRHASKKLKERRMITKVASIAGPPSAMAVTQTAINAPEVPIAKT